MKQMRLRFQGWLGRTLTALCGGMLAVNLLLIAGLLAILAFHGLGYFWQRPLERFDLSDGRAYLAEVHERKPVAEGEGDRLRLKIGNRDLDGLEFAWVDESEIVARTIDREAYLLERLEWGNFHGRLVEVLDGEKRLSGPEDHDAFAALVREKRRQFRKMRQFEKGRIGDLNHDMETARRKRTGLERRAAAGEDVGPAIARIETRLAAIDADYARAAETLFTMREALERETAVFVAADGRARSIPVGEIVRAVRPNRLGFVGTAGLYGSRLWEFLSDEPREANTQGGIFPAIFGTVMMVFIMTIVVAPFGVLAALFLREYSKQGPFVRFVRIAVNNLAGVPSIVFGIFGLGFFVYFMGGSVDRLFFSDTLPTPTFGTGGILWASLTLALLTVPVVIVSTEEGLSAVPRAVREGSLALGATKFETMRKVVVPAAAPGIMTGLILAMARAAGEVAPLMIVGMVKLAPSLPVDGHFPFLHLDRKFMHLGFHIYDLGFQSPNVESVKPLVFATALLLIVIIAILNMVAISARTYLREKYKGGSV